MPIRQLPPALVNKIAAGEVVERPASAVKELMENSIDAGATRIDVTVEKGGCEVLRVTDNGRGITAAELPLAAASHATSKIQSTEDLFSVGTLGFRGEALASIAAVSRLTIRSRTPETSEGAELEIVGGEAQGITPVGCPPGTTIEVRQLFFNTPVRHKFLRTTQTEAGHVTDVFTRLALAYPDIHFALASNGRIVHDLPPTTGIRSRVATFFGTDLAEALIEVESEADGVRLHGFVANPMHSRANSRMQYLFLNGRAIRDRSLQHALGEAYRGLLLTGRQPICFLRLDMPAELVDVNVHPTKLEVRFQDAGRIYSQLLGTLRTKFLTTDLAARVKPPVGNANNSDDDDDGGSASPSQLVAWAKEQLGQALKREENSCDVDGTSLKQQGKQSPSGPLELHDRETTVYKRYERVAAEIVRDDMEAESSNRAESFDHAAALRVGHLKYNALQVHNRYLVVETAAGIEVIDQHALHERILYERIRNRLGQHVLESQKLLVPEPVDLAASEAAAVLQNAEVLARLGLIVEPFGGETVLITSFPAILNKLSPAEVLRELAGRLELGGRSPEAEDLMDDLLHTIACKAAVKYGDPLATAEIDALLDERHLVRDGHHCPHGRPTTLVFTREELDRQFKRI